MDLKKTCARCKTEQDYEQFVNEGGIIATRWCRTCRSTNQQIPQSDRIWDRPSAEEVFGEQNRRRPQWWDRIWMCVLAQLFFDLVGRDGASEIIRLDAWRFFFSNSPVDRHRREAICSICDMDVDYVQQVARQKLGPGWATMGTRQNELKAGFDQDGNVLDLMRDEKARAL